MMSLYKGLYNLKLVRFIFIDGNIIKFQSRYIQKKNILSLK